MLHRLPHALPLCLLWAGLACGKASDGQPAPGSSGGSRTRDDAGASGSAWSPTPGAGGTARVAEAGAVGSGAGTESSGGYGGRDVAASNASLLVFSRTAGYRHDSIRAGVSALKKLASDRGWRLETTEDASRFSDAGLAEFNAVIFLSTTGDVLDDSQQAAFERFIRAGNGFIGIHSASDTEYDWAWYGGLVGAYFREHPAVQTASVVVEDAEHPATRQLPNPWPRNDEWYAFQSNPRSKVHVLLSLDEQSYQPGTANMDGDHPIAWCHEYDGGRAFYTALGHTDESYADPLFMGHLAGAVSWVLAR